MVETSADSAAKDMTQKMHLSPAVERDLRQRLNHIEGYVRGIQRMLDEQAECEELLTQIAAVKAALNQVVIRLLDEHMSMCVATYVSTEDERALERFTRVLAMVLKRT